MKIIEPAPPTGSDFFNSIWKSQTWVNILYLFLRFPMGIFSFSLTVSLLAASLSMISFPVIYRYPWFDINWPGDYFWVIDTVPETIVVALIGVILLFASLFVLNLLAWVYGSIAKVLLGA